MTSITFQDGKVVMRDGKVGTEQGCCCGCCGCSCPDCNGGVTIELTYGGETFASTCTDGVYSAGFSCAGMPAYCDTDNSHGGMSVDMYCEPDAGSPHGIIWRVSVVNSYAAFDPGLSGLYCTKTYHGTVEADANCLPVAGEVTLTLVDTNDGGGCGLLGEPTVVVQRA